MFNKRVRLYLALVLAMIAVATTVNFALASNSAVDGQSANSVDAIDAVLNGVWKVTVCDLFTVRAIWRTVGSAALKVNAADQRIAKIVAAANPNVGLDGHT